MRGTQGHSIAVRLTLGLAAIALIVFGVVGVILQWTLERELVRAEQQEIEAKADVVRHFLDEVRLDKDVATLRHRLDDLLIGNPQMRIWLVAADGAVLYGDKKLSMRSEADGRFTVVRDDGVVMGARRWPVAATAALPAAALVTAFDTRGRDRLVRGHRYAVLLVGGAGLLVAVASSAWVTRQALRPLRQLALQVAAISPQALSTRLTARGTAAEIQTLVLAFNRSLDRVELAYGHLEAFSADVAHELRTPLATMINGAEIVLARPRAKDELEHTLASNLEELRELAGVVNDMLFLAHADRGGLASGLQDVDIRAQAALVAEYFEATLEDRHQRLTIEGQATVTANEALMRRALVNLLSNASRYTSPHHGIEIAIEQSHGGARLTVRNPGPEIRAELLPRLFDRFFRGDTARNRSGENHGLGLAIVRAIAVMHGGDVFVRSANGFTEVGFTVGSIGSSRLQETRADA